MAPRKIIIDTDPGVDDILAMLLACSAMPEELQVLLISVTYGNIDVQNCLRNVVSLFYHIEKEIQWRTDNKRPIGFETLRRSKPLVAVGTNHPLADTMLMADFFHGRDGLGDIHKSHPHLTPADTWKQLFEPTKEFSDSDQAIITEELKKSDSDSIFTPSRTSGHKEILRLLRENEPDTITIVAIGPLTNLALAAAEDPETFLKTKEIVVMGGAINEPGNVGQPHSNRAKQKQQHIPPPPPPPPLLEPAFRLIKQPPGPIRDMLNLRNQISPFAEFNTFADTVAAARVYALTAPKPHTTMPPTPPAPKGQPEGQHPPPYLAPYPEELSKRLKVTLFPLDITEKHVLTRGQFNEAVKADLEAKSPLAEWMTAFMEATFQKVESLHPNVTGDDVGLSLHDPLTVWYCIDGGREGWEMVEGEDVRVETSGQWTRGMNVVDRRARRRRADDDEHEVPGDTDGWLTGGYGNRLTRCVRSGSEATFGREMLRRIFAQ